MLVQVLESLDQLNNWNLVFRTILTTLIFLDPFASNLLGFLIFLS